MDNRIVEFTERHAHSADPDVAAAVRAIRAGEVALRTVAEGASARELSSTYSVRAQIAERQGRAASAAVLRSISQRCRVDMEASCSIWMFSGPSESFAVFELLPSHAIAGCLRFEGPFDDAHS